MEITKYICPVCGMSKLQDGDICRVCFWEMDSYQYSRPEISGGANSLSLEDYKKWWLALETKLPAIMKKYNVIQDKISKWKYDELIIPRENIKNFISEMTNLNIEIEASFYHLCKKNKLNSFNFVGYPIIISENIKENNNEVENIIFTDNPYYVCEKYHLSQVKQLLDKSKNITKAWQEMTPNISILPNPKFLPNM